jgi:hypothetical protein
MYKFLRTVEYPWGNGVTAGVILVTPGAAKTGVTRGNYPGNPGNGVITTGNEFRGGRKTVTPGVICNLAIPPFLSCQT